MTEADLDPVPDYAGLIRLDGQGFVVLGAGQGIGRQTAHALAQAGAKVVCVGRSREMTERVADEVGGRAMLGDATDRADMERIFAEAEQTLGGVHGVVDILGMVRRKSLAEFTDEDWDWQFDIVLRHAFLALQIGGAAITRSGGGSLTFVGSTAGFVGTPQHTVYGAAKAGLHHLVASAALEFAPKGVRVNCVSPGAVLTPRVRGFVEQGLAQGLEEFYPLGFLCKPADIAAPILFMASEMGRYVTGQTLVVDGGHITQSPMPATALGKSKDTR